MSSLAIVAEKVEPARPLVGGYETHPDIPLEEVIRLAEAVERIPTEDHQPVDNIISERLMHLLVETLNVSWKPTTADGSPRTFIALANVGLNYSINESAVVPDVMLSVDVAISVGFRGKMDLSYFTWGYGKLPEVVIEFVSPTLGGEDTDKLHRYERIGVEYYAIFDPLQLLGKELLRTFHLRDGIYHPIADHFFPKIGLGLTPWAGTYGHKTYDHWLRWRDQQGVLLPIATESIEREAERANQEAERAEREAERANQEAERAGREVERANQEAERAEREAERAAALAAKLREVGIDPDQILKAE